jgi:hypothetical protein
MVVTLKKDFYSSVFILLVFAHAASPKNAGNQIELNRIAMNTSIRGTK